MSESFFSVIPNSFSYIQEGFSFVEIPKFWNGRKVCAIVQNVFAAFSIICTISAIFCWVASSTPFFILSFSILSLSLVASHAFRKLSIRPLPPMDFEKNSALVKECSQLLDETYPTTSKEVATFLLKKSSNHDTQLNLERYASDNTPLTSKERTETMRHIAETLHKLKSLEAILPNHSSAKT